MATIRKYKINLNTAAITQSGQKCNMLEAPIVISDHPNTIINCQVTDDILYVQLMEDNGIYHPFKVEIDCDDCEICPPFLVSVTPCNTDNDCDECQICDTVKKLCVDKCPVKCDNGACVNCTDDNECFDGKKCINGDCICPPETPYWNGTKCVECLDNTVLDPCEVCIDGQIRTKDCGDWHCDPTTEDCVECLKEGDCEVNEECKDKECQCKPGYERDENGDCVIAPPCATDDDCDVANCEVCDPNRICVRKECLEGFELDSECNCVEIDDPYDDCVECDTYKGCPTGFTCHLGCCIPCDYFDCEGTDDCSNKPGCECNGSEACVDDGSDRDECLDTLDLTKGNCSLEVELNKKDECNCGFISFVTDLSATGNDNLGWIISFDMSLRKYKAATYGSAKQLPLMNDYNNTLYDIAHNEMPTSGTFEIKIYNQVLDETTVKGYDDVLVTTHQGDFSNGDAEQTWQSALIKGLNNVDAEGRDIYSIKIMITLTSDLVFPNGCAYSAGTLLYSKTYKANGECTLDSECPSGTVCKTGNCVYNWENLSGFKSISSDDMRYPLFTFWRKATEAGEYDKYRKVYLKPDGTGRVETNLYGPDKIAVEIDNETKFDLLPTDYDGGLWSGYWYHVAADCSCASDKNIQALFCQTDEILIDEWSQCGSKVKFQEFLPCAINQDVARWLPNVVPAKAQTWWKLTFQLADTTEEVRYIKHVYDEFVPTNHGHVMVFDANKNAVGQKFYGYEFGFTSSGTAIEIVGIKAEQEINGNLYCPVVLDPFEREEDLILTTSVCGTGPNAVLVIHGTTNNGNILSGSSDIVVEGGTLVEVDGAEGDGSTEYKFSIVKGQDTKITVRTNSGCQLVDNINESCCEGMSVSISTVGSNHLCGGDLKLTANVTGGTGTITYKWYDPNGVELHDTDSVLDLTGPVDGGVYTVEITDSLKCTDSATVQVSVYETPSVTFSGYSDFCVGGSTDLIATFGAEAIGMTLTYNMNGSPQSFKITDGLTKNFGPITETSIYEFLTLSNSDCIFNINETITINKVTLPIASISVDANTICDGNAVAITIAGTPGAVVHLSGGLSSVVIPADDDGDGYGEKTFSVTPTANTTYVITDIVLGDCHGLAGDSETVVVQSGTDVVLSNEECNILHTEKEFTFNVSPTLVKDDSGNEYLQGAAGGDVEVAAAVVTVTDLVNVKWIQVYYNDGTCTSNLIVNIEACECEDATASMSLSAEQITLGESITATAELTGAIVGQNYKFIWSDGYTNTVLAATSTVQDVRNITPSVAGAQEIYADIQNTLHTDCIFYTGSVGYNVNAVLNCNYCVIPLDSGGKYSEVKSITVKDNSGATVVLDGTTPGFNFPYCSCTGSDDGDCECPNDADPNSDTIASALLSDFDAWAQGEYGAKATSYIKWNDTTGNDCNGYSPRANQMILQFVDIPEPGEITTVEIEGDDVVNRTPSKYSCDNS